MERTPPGPAGRPPAGAPPRWLRQVLGFVLGLTGGLGVGWLALLLLADLSRSTESPVARFLLAVIGLLQLLWLVPAAYLGWRRRNVGWIVGVLCAALPLLVLDAICLGPAYFEGVGH